jgi:zinc transporter, ZIP family
MAALQDRGLAIAVGVALHNIPAGIRVLVPIFYPTGNRRNAFLYSVLSGLSEPLAAGVAYLPLLFFVGIGGGVIPPEVFCILFGSVTGIMVYISHDHLLPTSKAYGRGHDSLIDQATGMLIMALSSLLIK